MTRFENATPRPWYPYYAGPQDTHIIAGGGPIIKLLPVNGDKNQSQQEANAELIVTAVNARDGLMNAAQAAVHALKSYQYGNSSPDLAQKVIDALEAALNLARGERS